MYPMEEAAVLQRLYGNEIRLHAQIVRYTNVT